MLLHMALQTVSQKDLTIRLKYLNEVLMLSGTLTGSGCGYFIVHHSKNGQEMEAYFACLKQHTVA